MSLFNFNKMFNKLEKDEGIYSNTKFDSGGETILGITKNNFPLDFNEIYNYYKNGVMAKVEELTKKFYKKHFYNKLFDELDYHLAEKIFSLSVNVGTKAAIKILQVTLNTYFKSNLVLDGVYGKKSHSEILKNNQTSIRSAYIYRLMSWHEIITKNNPTQVKFLLGWWNRDTSF